MRIARLSDVRLASGGPVEDVWVVLHDDGSVTWQPGEGALPPGRKGGRLMSPAVTRQAREARRAERAK